VGVVDWVVFDDRMNPKVGYDPVGKFLKSVIPEINPHYVMAPVFHAEHNHPAVRVGKGGGVLEEVVTYLFLEIDTSTFMVCKELLDYGGDVMRHAPHPLQRAPARAR